MMDKIQTEEEYLEILERVWVLMNGDDDELLDELATLIEVYEEEHYPM